MQMPDEDTIRYFKYHNTEIIDNHDGTITFKVNTKCEMLDENNLCKIFDTRPDICREDDSKPNVRVIRLKECTEDKQNGIKYKVY